jgi:hypothetical protein
MLIAGLYRRWASLDAAQRRLLLEAAAATALVWAGLRLISFLSVQRMLDRLPAVREHEPDRSRAIASVNWAVTTVASRFPPATCLVQALAGAALLRRRGLACELRLGVRSRGPADGAAIEAHAWVECDGRVAVGAVDQLSELAVMTPPESA